MEWWSVVVEGIVVNSGGGGGNGSCSGDGGERWWMEWWSVVVEGDPDGDAVALFNYNAYGRTADDVRCTAMPQPVFNLGVELWLAAMPHLCEASRAAPPTHCQLLLYYALFNSAMGE